MLALIAIEQFIFLCLAVSLKTHVKNFKAFPGNKSTVGNNSHTFSTVPAKWLNDDTHDLPAVCSNIFDRNQCLLAIASCRHFFLSYSINIIV